MARPSRAVALTLTPDVPAAPDPALILAWLQARSIARGLPMPVPDCGGWRVETGSADELRRFVFAGPVPGLAELGRRTRDPLIALKLCGPGDLMRMLLPADWRTEAPAYVMTCDALAASRTRLTGYHPTLLRRGQVFEGRIESADGATAASGFAVEHGGVFIFDRIRTEPLHRRRGLASALMHMLAEARIARSSQYILVATEAGRALYEALGWRVLSPYTTARLQV
jgi:GNAT superfamily N-acetyltransferase